jgi:hypothetical protein
MASVAPAKKLPFAPLIVSAIVVVALIAGFIYLNHPASVPNQNGPASVEAKAYVRNLVLSDVAMKASENFMKQRLVEIEGRIGNNGTRSLQSVDVHCLFYGVDGREVYREKVPIVQAKTSALKPGEVRPFRLPFDNLPDAWNQAVPKLVIAQITFAE